MSAGGDGAPEPVLLFIVVSGSDLSVHVLRRKAWYRVRDRRWREKGTVPKEGGMTEAQTTNLGRGWGSRSQSGGQDTPRSPSALYEADMISLLLMFSLLVC